MNYFKDEEFKDTIKRRLVQWRTEEVVHRADGPTNLKRAHALGYKAKPGFIVVRAKVPKGGRKTVNPRGGRKPSASGRFFTTGKSKQWIAEERAADKYPNMEVLNSYFVGEDGISKWFEVILVDKNHPAVRKNKEAGWIAQTQHTGRVYRGLTSAGRKSRGLMHRGKKSTKSRPSLRAHQKKGK